MTLEWEDPDGSWISLSFWLTYRDWLMADLLTNTIQRYSRISSNSGYFPRDAKSLVCVHNYLSGSAMALLGGLHQWRQLNNRIFALHRSGRTYSFVLPVAHYRLKHFLWKGRALYLTQSGIFPLHALLGWRSWKLFSCPKYIVVLLPTHHIFRSYLAHFHCSRHITFYTILMACALTQMWHLWRNTTNHVTGWSFGYIFQVLQLKFHLDCVCMDR